MVTIVIVNPDKKYIKSNGKEKYGFYMDDILVQNLKTYFIEGVKNKWDGIGLFTGMEGSGKSTFAATVAHFCDPTFFFGNTLDRVVFTFDQFMKAIDDSQPGQAIVLDEAILLFMAQDASTYLQKMLQKKITLIRKKRLYIFIVIPSFFLLRIYLAVLRSRFLVHTYTPDGVRRGFFKFYSYDTKRRLYFAGKKYMDMGAVKYDFHSKFVDTDGFFFDKKEYERKKDEAILMLSEDKETKRNALSIRSLEIRKQRDFLILKLYNELIAKGEIDTVKSFRDYLEKNYEMKFTPEGVSKILRMAKGTWYESTEKVGN